MNKGSHYSQSVTSTQKKWRLHFIPILFLPLLLAFVPTGEHLESAPPCADPNPITRWNRLSLAQRNALNDGDILTNVTGFHSGFCNGMGDPITINISATGAPQTGTGSVVNNEVPSRWGKASFNNERSDSGPTGNRYCFEFSEPVPVEISSLDHAFFHDHEQISIEATLSGFGVNLVGSLGGDFGPAVVQGNGTTVLHFDAREKLGAGGWWEASTDGVAVDLICVEYFATAEAMSETGAEPFNLFICGADRCLDDADVEEASLSKATICSEQAESGVPGNMDVTFRMEAVNKGTDVLGNLQITDNLSDYFPAGTFFGLKNIAFAPNNSVSDAPALNMNFNGSTSKNLFSGFAGQMNPGDTLAIDLTVELDANVFPQFENITNHAFFWATGSTDNLVTAASDAPPGAPGDTGGKLDPLRIQIPAINLATHGVDYVPQTNCIFNDAVDVIVEVRYENTGNVTVDHLGLDVDFASLLGPAFLGLEGVPVISFSTASQNPTFNPAFNGTALNNSYFDGISGRIEQGQAIHIQTQIKLDPDAPGANLAIQFSAAARGLNMNDVPLPGCHDDDVMWAFDDSDAGLSPEDINDGYLGHVDFHDDPLPLNLPNIGLAKEVSIFSLAASQTPGNMDVRFRVKMKNTGNVDLTSIELLDDVIAQLGDAFVAVTQMPFIIASTASDNPSFGFFPGTILDGTDGILEPNQEITIEFVMEMNPDGGSSSFLTNQAEISVSAPGLDGNAIEVTTLSDSGDDPAGTNLNEPGDTGCSDDATAINLPGLMVAQEIVGVDYATSGTFGHFDAIVQVVVQNIGSVDLDDFRLEQNLAAATQLGSAFVSVTGAPQIMPVGAHGTMTTASAHPQVNPNYNGTGNLLDDFGVGLLASGEIFVLQYRIEVDPEAAGAPGIPKLQVEGFGTGEGPFGNPMTISDSSDAGHIPQSTNPGRLGDSGGTNDPTPLTNCGTQIGALSCNNSIQVSMNEDCLAGITPSMILEGEFWQCASDDYLPLGAYYEIFMVTDPFGTIVEDAIPATPNVFEIDGSFVGQTLTVKAKDVVNGNSCWGNLVLEDKMGPTFDCPSPIEILCYESLASVPPPVAMDNCDPDPEVTFVAQHIIDNDICDDGIYRVRRTYTAVDQYGNQAPNQCIFEIHFSRPDVTFPQDINWFCEQYASYPNIIEPLALHPIIKDQDLLPPDIDVNPDLPANVLSNTGSGTVNNTGGVCDYHVSSSDQILAACGNTFKIIRTWSVTDWCTGQVITQGAFGEDNVQTIKIIDETAPTISMQNFTVSATIPGNQHQVCRSQGLLPPPDAFDDNCQPTDELNVQIITAIGEAVYIAGGGENGGLIPPPGLPIGVHNIVYRVTDDCGNTDSVVVQATVVDDITPTAVCDELTEANLTTSGFATVFAETFDDGSNDNCCLIGNFKVRRMDDPCDDGEDDTVFGPSVTFCCEDVGTGPHMVVFRVFDCVGNFNDCMVEVVVNDKQEPLLLSCPNNDRMTCNEYADDFETQVANLMLDPTAQNELFDDAFGTAIFQDNCAFSVNKNISVNLTQCLEGSITRTWSAVDPGGLTSLSCSQTIFVDHISDWVVEFAPDVTISCGQTVPDFVEPEIFFEDCEMVGESYEDVVSTVVQDACFKIERTWVIINWCVLGALTDEEYAEMPESQLGLPFPACDLDGDGDCDDRTFRDSWGNGVFPDASIATQPTGPDTDPDTDPWDGYITYTQTIKATDTVDPVFLSGCGTLPDVCIQNTTCGGTVTLVEPTVDDCSPMVDISATSTLGNGFGPFTNVAPGTYTITFTAMDNCNNQSSCQASVTVRDCKKPTPFCKTGINVGIMDTSPPMIAVVADSLDDGSFDNCPGELTFSFSSDATNTIDTFFCFNVGENEVEIWVTDASGNQDFCTSVITVLDGLNNCNDDSLVVNVAGVIDTELGEPVEGVNISISGQYSSNQATPLSGDFSFANVPEGNDVTITPTLNDDPLNGVTTFDLVLITQHILGNVGLDSPYKMIAADANNSGGITTFDLLTIRKLILFIEDEFPNNSSWRFVDKNFVFPNGGDPWATPFPEVISVNDIPADVLDADFVAIKVGDVNGSASASLLGDDLGDRSPDETFFLHAEERNLIRGEKFNLAISAKEIEVDGFQFTLQFDPSKLEFLSVENGQLEPNHFGFTFVDEGYLTVSWNGDLREEYSLAELRFRALDDLRLGNAVQVNSRYTQSEAYRKDGEMMDVQIQFTDGDVAGHFELYQNVPNPFSDATIISFHLPRASMASLTITDVQGRTVRTVTDLYEAGYNEIELGKDQLPSNGIFYYRLETPTDSDTKTMIMLE